MSGPLSDQHLDEIAALLARLDAVPSMGHLDSADLGWVRPVLHDLLAEIRRLRGERDHLASAFDKLGDQMGELVQAARSERDRYTAENRRLRAELADVAGYLAAIHRHANRHANRHDVLGENLGCAGCALLGRIDGPQVEDGAAP